MVSGTDGDLPDDPAAPPMHNGEVVFEAPWQGRVFGMARAMCQAGLFDWEEFRACLIEALAEPAARDSHGFDYYRHFLAALETVLARKGLVTPEDLASRSATLAARPHGHDH
jgi:nitrile hydratase accessory protein